MPLEKILNKEGDRVVLAIDRLKNQSTYYVEGGQAAAFAKILLEGITSFPKGFYRQGYGLPKPAGTFLVQALQNTFGKPFEFAISTSRKSGIKRSGKLFSVTLNYADFLRIQQGLQTIRADANVRLKGLVSH